MEATEAQGYTMRRTCEAAPVQYEGEVDGKAWYFRARYAEWTFGVGDDVTAAVIAAMDSTGEFSQRGEHDPTGDGWGASWMDHGDAEAIIRRCIAAYRARNG